MFADVITVMNGAGDPIAVVLTHTHTHTWTDHTSTVEEEQARERLFRKFALRSGVNPQQPPLEEQQITVSSSHVTEVVVEEDASPPRAYLHQLDTLSATTETLTSLLSPGDQSRSLPGPPPPSPEVPSRTIPALPVAASGSGGRSFDSEVRALSLSLACVFVCMPLASADSC